MGPKFECLGKTPFASLLAALLVIIGTCVFCGTSYRALQIIIIGVFKDKFRFSISSLEVLQVMFVIIGVVMGVYAIVLLIFGFLATGATRSNIYSGAKCIMGGRITAAFFIILSYILTIGWMAVLSVCVVSVVAYGAVDSICSSEVYSKTAKDLDESHYCFNITRFGIYDVEDGTNSLCGYSDVRALCNKVIEAGPLFCVACAAASIIIIGMCEDDDDDMYTYFLDDPFVRTTLRGISVGRIGTKRKEYVSMHYVSCECEDDDDDMYTYFLDDPFVRTTLRGISVGRIGTKRKEYVSMHYVSCEIHFLVTLSANYTRIKISKELTEYRDAVETEELELHSSNPRGLPPYRDDGLDM